MDRAIGAAERHRPLRPELLCGFFRPARIGGFGALDRLRLGSDDAPEHPSRLGHAPAYGMEADRSEEHTSELQSLMRNSYDVVCLKKTNIHKRSYTRKCMQCSNT